MRVSRIFKIIVEILNDIWEGVGIVRGSFHVSSDIPKDHHWSPAKANE
jgi:hypothetical protein